MSFRYDLTGVKDYESTCYYNNILLPFVHEVLFMTMPTGIPEITEKNYIEFAARANIAGGASEFSPESMIKLTPDQLHPFIGLKTNASTKTRTEFFKDTMDGLMATLVWKEGQRLRK